MSDIIDIKEDEINNDDDDNDNEILIDQVIFKKRRKTNVEIIELGGSSEDEKPSVSFNQSKKCFRGFQNIQSGVS